MAEKNTGKAKPFQKGQSGNPNGRKKGVANKTTTTLKEAILLAAEKVGMDGAGKDGLVGYLQRVAVEDVKAFAGLLGKVLPLQLTTDADSGPVILKVVYEDRPDGN